MRVFYGFILGFSLVMSIIFSSSLTTFAFGLIVTDILIDIKEMLKNENNSKI